MDIQDYTPSQDVLAYLDQVHFVGVVGPTAVGKSTLIKRALERDPDLHLVCSTTSRPPRPGEQDGVDMHFRSKDEMLGRIARQEYITALGLFENIYATAPEDCADHGISLLPLMASGVPVYRQLPFHSFRVVFVLPPSYEVWLQRIQGRATNVLAKRLAEATESLEYALQDAEVYFVLNDDLDIATENFVDLLREHAPDGQQQAACRQLAHDLLVRLQQE
jgi:guanylate kinase